MADGSSNNIDLKDICHELDTLSIRILQLMNDLIQCKLNIEKAVKNGSLDLAKARYIMGNRNVSSLQLPTEDGSEVQALTTVISSKDEISNLNNLSYQLKRISPQEKQRSPKTSIKQRSTKEYEEFIELDEEESQPLLLQSSESKSAVQDPIKWFGVLVPQNLRQGQAWFQKAIELAVQSANIQAELDASRIQFQNLLKRKCDYIDSVREP
ncbi:vacuolar ATPase assembly protein VMA22 [Lycorma delicatula]|uniref:vacuolar ATPase assembly protein VMA22 n=1 Tax=Lycorma delicatula TaxID=130591 RepID=UPI003F519991